MVSMYPIVRREITCDGSRTRRAREPDALAIIGENFVMLDRIVVGACTGEQDPGSPHVGEPLDPVFVHPIVADRILRAADPQLDSAMSVVMHDVLADITEMS